MMLDRDRLKAHQLEFSYLTNRFVIDHMVRLHGAFDGDVLAAVVLGTIAQRNAGRIYEEIAARSDQSMDELVRNGTHERHLRPCNAMSVSASTGIPRETVRRKISWLKKKGWVQQVGRDKLFVTAEANRHFASFDADTVDHFHSVAMQLICALQRRVLQSQSGGGPGTRHL